MATDNPMSRCQIFLILTLSVLELCCVSANDKTYSNADTLTKVYSNSRLTEVLLKISDSVQQKNYLNEDGTLYATLTYINGLKRVKTVFYQNGVINHKEVFNRVGVTDTFLLFYRSGKIKNSIILGANSSHSYYCYYYPSGELFLQGKLVNEKRSDKWYTYSPQKDTINIKYYVNGHIEYVSSKNIIYDNLEDSNSIGWYLLYSHNYAGDSIITRESYYIDGIRAGWSVEYYESGDLKAISFYDNKRIMQYMLDAAE